jgi:uroporphyrinogen decarboxylase
MKKPDFDNLLKVLARGKPSRPTLFEFIVGNRIFEHLLGRPVPAEKGPGRWRFVVDGFAAAGYDYAVLPTWEMDGALGFARPDVHQKASYSLNEASAITDRKSFGAYAWPDPDRCDYSAYDAIRPIVPDGMKIVACGPGGLLENAIALTGYDNLCIMIYEEPGLAKEVFDAIGSRLLRYYEIVSSFPVVGACIVNDDWGFKTQTMLSTDQMREFVTPWHKRMVAAIHAEGKPAIMHSCGNLEKVMDDVIDDIKFDGKHSYEDAILPVERAWERWGDRIAILGGLDVDFLCRSTPQAVAERSRKLLEKTGGRSFALGSGNSIPDYVPLENYLAMIRTICG